tara:strand:- start:427 stop:705 length:279 start_codon:yes stop_codon:yes gene_type:complete
MRENIMTAEQYEKKNMVEALKRNACSFEFTKKDGSLRQMIATLNPVLIPEACLPKTARKIAEDSSVVRVFDTAINEWRSFDTSTVTSFNYYG